MDAASVCPASLNRWQSAARTATGSWKAVRLTESSVRTRALRFPDTTPSRARDCLARTRRRPIERSSSMPAPSRRFRRGPLGHGPESEPIPDSGRITPEKICGVEEEGSAVWADLSADRTAVPRCAPPPTRSNDEDEATPKLPDSVPVGRPPQRARAAGNGREDRARHDPRGSIEAGSRRPSRTEGGSTPEVLNFMRLLAGVGTRSADLEGHAQTQARCQAQTPRPAHGGPTSRAHRPASSRGLLHLNAST
jgi:hypothetical protein